MEPESSLGQSSLGQSSLVPAAPGDDDRQDETKKDLDKIAGRFADCYGRQPDKQFLDEASQALKSGKPVDGLLEVISKAAERKPKHPDRYTQKAITEYEPQLESKPWQPSQQPDGELADWERDWLEEVKRRKAARAEKEVPHEPD